MADPGRWSEPESSELVTDLTEESSEETADSRLSSPAHTSSMGMRVLPRFDTKSFQQVMDGLRRISWCVYPQSLAVCLRDAAKLVNLELRVRCR